MTAAEREIKKAESDLACVEDNAVLTREVAIVRLKYWRGQAETAKALIGFWEKHEGEQYCPVLDSPIGIASLEETE